MTWIWTFLYSTLSATIGGLGTWWIVNLHDKKILQQFDNDITQLNGNWYGKHLSSKDGKTIICNHYYKLTKARNRRVTGWYEERTATPPYKFSIEGRIEPGKIIMINKSSIAGEISVTLLFNIINLNQMIGFHLGNDYNGNPFVSLLVMSKNDLNNDDFINIVEKHSEELINSFQAERK